VIRLDSDRAELADLLSYPFVGGECLDGAAMCLASFEGARRRNPKLPTPTLVQGMLTSPYHTNVVKMVHAWIEFELGGVTYCYDIFGLTPRDLYYARNRATEMHRYTLDDVARSFTETGEFGFHPRLLETGWTREGHLGRELHRKLRRKRRRDLTRRAATLRRAS
jgi:hypothetical protein